MSCAQKDKLMWSESGEGLDGTTRANPTTPDPWNDPGMILDIICAQSLSISPVFMNRVMNFAHARDFTTKLLGHIDGQQAPE
jgi:hypothetical protein